MAIKRTDVDRQMVDFSDLASGMRLPPVHPGEVLREEYLEPLGLSVYRLARELKIARPRLNDLVLGRRGVTIDTALRLGRYFDTTPEFWLNLQTRHDLDVAERTLRREVEREIQPRSPARQRGSGGEATGALPRPERQPVGRSPARS